MAENVQQDLSMKHTNNFIQRKYICEHRAHLCE